MGRRCFSANPFYESRNRRKTIKRVSEAAFSGVAFARLFSFGRKVWDDGARFF